MGGGGGLHIRALEGAMHDGHGLGGSFSPKERFSGAVSAPIPIGGFGPGPTGASATGVGSTISPLHVQAHTSAQVISPANAPMPMASSFSRSGLTLDHLDDLRNSLSAPRASLIKNSYIDSRGDASGGAADEYRRAKDRDDEKG
jgi:hypothetical protein